MIYYRHSYNYNDCLSLERDDHGWEVTCTQFSHDSFFANLEVLGNLHHTLLSVHTDGPYIIRAKPVPDTIQLTLNLPNQHAQLRWMGHKLDMPSLTVSQGGKWHHIRSDTNIDAIVIEIPMNNKEINLRAFPHLSNIIQRMILPLTQGDLQIYIDFFIDLRSAIIHKDFAQLSTLTSTQLFSHLDTFFSTHDTNNCIFIEEHKSLEIFNAVVDYIHENLHNCRLTTGDLCATFDINARSIQRLFKRYYDLTPLQFIKFVRLSNAKKILQKDLYMNIADVAHGIGYKHMGRFSSDFKSLIGMNPLEYSRLRNVAHISVQSCEVVI